MTKQKNARVSASTVATIGLIGLVIGFLLGCLTSRRFNPCTDAVVKSDTTIVRDTLFLPVPEPIDKGIKRRIVIKPQEAPKIENDTSTLLEDVKADTAIRLTPDGDVSIPIEQKEYKTDEYTAVVEGWRPKLVSMEVYPKTVTITNTKVKKPRWSVSAGLGAGYAPNIGIYPNIGITAGFVLWSR